MLQNYTITNPSLLLKSLFLTNVYKLGRIYQSYSYILFQNKTSQQRAKKNNYYKLAPTSEVFGL